MNSHLVSVITPSYNSSKYISQTIDSVLSQTYQNWEMIIVDDASPDNSNDIIEDYCKKDSRIKLIKLEKNSGPAVARNRAIQEAKGRYISFLDADDLWVPKKLEEQLKFMTNNNLAFTFSSYDIVDESGNRLGSFITREKISYKGLLKTCSVGCLTAIYDTKKLDKVYMPNIIKRQDYALWLRILREIKVTKGILEPLATYRLRKNSVSSNKLKAAIYQWKIYRDVENLNIFQSAYYFAHYVYNGLLKYKGKS
jgi:glycosyltransferase involved in cell wall biosynthesis